MRERRVDAERTARARLPCRRCRCRDLRRAAPAAPPPRCARSPRRTSRRCRPTARGGRGVEQHQVMRRRQRLGERAVRARRAPRTLIGQRKVGGPASSGFTRWSWMRSTPALAASASASSGSGATITHHRGRGLGLIADLPRAPGVDAARALRVEDEPQPVGADGERRAGVLGAGDAADLDDGVSRSRGHRTLAAGGGEERAQRGGRIAALVMNTSPISTASQRVARSRSRSAGVRGRSRPPR